MQIAGEMQGSEKNMRRIKDSRAPGRVNLQIVNVT